MPDEKEIESSQDNSSVVLQGASEDPQPPSVVPPKTKLPAQFNQQNNYYQQIPSNAWDRLSADQVVDLSTKIMKHMDTLDERNFNLAMDQINRRDMRGRLIVCIGSVVVIVAFVITAYLALHGHEFIALTISLPLATILAMLTGNRLLN